MYSVHRTTWPNADQDLGLRAATSKRHESAAQAASRATYRRLARNRHICARCCLLTLDPVGSLNFLSPPLRADAFGLVDRLIGLLERCHLQI